MLARFVWLRHVHTRLVLLLGLTAVALGAAAAPDPAVVHITLLHMNDIYEITPVSGGTQGGLARVATIRKELLQQNPHTYTILAGDLFNPSALGTAQVAGERLDGRQMVDVMNRLGLDYATFGNHEFDLQEDAFYKRLAESKATWFSSNVRKADQQPIPHVPPHVLMTVANAAGATVRVGMFGVTLASNPASYIAYRPVPEAAREQVTALRPQVDILIAVTHLAWEQDRDLVLSFPEIDLVVGGHEHENIQTRRGPRLTPICKADANARTVYVHDLWYNITTRKLTIESRLRLVNADIPEEPDVGQTVATWVQLAFDAFRQQGFEPDRVVTHCSEPLDGTEASVRSQSTRLTEVIAAGMLHAVAGAELAVLNGGSIRIDDTLPPGPITEYDLIRTMPFGGKVMAVQMRGRLLQQVLDAGEANRGRGGYLQTAQVQWEPTAKRWQVQGVPLQAEKTYLVAMNDFLLSGRETGLEFLTRTHADLRVQETGSEPDIRKTFLAELQRVYGAGPASQH
jgi:5'-nucleotidase